MSPDMATPVADLVGPVIGAWLLLGWVYRRALRSAVAYLAKRAGKEQR